MDRFSKVAHCDEVTLVSPAGLGPLLGRDGNTVLLFVVVATKALSLCEVKQCESSHDESKQDDASPQNANLLTVRAWRCLTGWRNLVGVRVLVWRSSAHVVIANAVYHLGSNTVCVV
jgi:hypothetical protein